jgi:hypothetical protein
MKAGFVLSGCPIVGQAIAIGGVDIRDLGVLRQEKKLFPHLGGASTAIFFIGNVGQQPS